MKVAVVSTGLRHITRGIESWALALAGELNRQGVDATLFMGSGPCKEPCQQTLWCLPRNSSLNTLISRIGLKIGGWRIGFGAPYQIEQTTFASVLICALRRGGFDIVHLQDPWLAKLLERARRRGRHVAQVVLVNGTEEPIGFLKQFPYVQESAPYYYERDMAEVKNRHWFCIPNFVDVSTFHPAENRTVERAEFGLTEDDFVVLAVGALNTSRKRMDWLVKECARVDAPNLKLVLRGAFEQESKALLDLAKRELGTRVVVLKQLDFDKMPSLYACSDVFALCSLYELFGIVFLEAMASGIPCIGHTYPVTQWILDEAGISIDMEKPGLLSKTLEELIANPEKRMELGKAGREKAVNVFSQDAVTRQIIEMYKKVLGEKRNRG